MRRKTHEEFVKEVYELVGDEYTVIDTYVNAITKILIKHNHCDNEFLIAPNKFLTGTRCLKCAKNHLKTTEEFKKEVFDLVGDEYEVVGEYSGSHEKIKIKHVLCGTINNIKASHFLSGVRCPLCNRGRKNHEDYVREVEEIHPNEYEFITKYQTQQIKITVKHKKCDHVWDTLPTNLLKKKNSAYCPNCNGGVPYDLDKFKELINELYNGEYQVLGNYINSITPIEMLHKKCGHVFYPYPSNIANNKSGCPKCASSKGEIRISSYLEKMNIPYNIQYRFDDCKYKYTLPFDFAIIDDIGDIIFLIEFDGRQHFEAVDHFGGNEEFEQIKLRDSIKNQYCKDNSIPLYRIPYWKFDEIESILIKLIHNEPIDVDETSFLIA